MKLSILNKETQEPMLMLSQDDYGMSVVGGDPKLVQALKLNQFKDLKEIADYINSDPNGPYIAQPEDDDQKEEQEQSKPDQLDERIKPALAMIKEMMTRVKSRQDQDKQEEDAKKPEVKAMSLFDAEAVLPEGSMVYVSYDGDNIGNAVARAERGDDEEQLRTMSNKINAGQDLFRQWATLNGGEIIEQGGDEGLCKVPKKALKDVENFRAQYAQLVGATCSIGIGQKISEATDTRMLAKLKGKNCSLVYDQSTRKELKLRLDEKGDAESMKIAEALQVDSQTEQPQPITPEQASGAQTQGSVPQSPQANGSEAPSNQTQEGNQDPQAEAGAPEQQGQVASQFSPELAQAMRESLNKQQPPPSLRNGPLHDQDIENADYSDSEDPDFSKKLRYVMKYGSKR
jgi:hypothetical protein